MARCAGLLRNRLNERTLLSWGQTNESLPAADSSSPVIAVMQPAHALLANHCTVFQRACPACASPQSKTHQEQCILKSSLTSGSNFSVALNGQTRGTSSEPAEWADTSVVGTDK